MARLLLVALLGLAGWGWSQPLVVTAVEAPPTLDGRLDDEFWRTAVRLGPFRDLKTGEEARPVTEAMLGCDRSTLYVGFVCHEADVSALRNLANRRDGLVYEDDCVELFLAPTAGGVPYYHFLANAAGVQRDEEGRDVEWNAEWSVRTAVAVGRWTAEIAIPFASLPMTTAATEGWRLNACRVSRVSGTLATWQPMAESFHQPERFGHAVLRGVDVSPWIAATLRRRAREVEERAEALAGALGQAVELADAAALAAEVEGAKARASRVRTQAAATASLGELRRAEQELEEVVAQVATQERRGEVLRALARAPEACRQAGYLAGVVSPMHKLVRGRSLPSLGAGVEMVAARREAESAQVVVVAVERGLAGVSVSVGPLRGPGGNVLPADSATLHLVGYVPVSKPSSRARMGTGLFPDPLPENQAIDIPPAAFESFWLTVRVPEDCPAGEYRGEVQVAPRNAPSVRIPVVLRVWDFALPRTSSLRSCYLLDPGAIAKYHRFPGWQQGAWVGADSQGRADYYGSATFEHGIETEGAKEGARCIRIAARELRKGTHEAPRFCFHTDPIPVDPKASYELAGWYRTAAGAEGCAGAYVPGMGSLSLPPSENWRRFQRRFPPSGAESTRVYLGAYAEGEVWYDAVALRRVGAAANLLPNPSFEEGTTLRLEELVRRYRLDALAHRASTANIAQPTVRVAADGQSASIDWTAFDQEVQFYLDHGQNAFNVSWCQLRGGWGKVAQADPAKDVLRRELLRRTQLHLERKGWLDLAYIYAIDEPGFQAFGDVRQAFELVHEAAPRLKRLLTFGYGATRPWNPGAEGLPAYAQLADVVDVFVPHTDCFDPEFLDTQRGGNKEIWAYVCISAGHPYLNMWGIDSPAWEHRILFWQFFRERVEGFLYWQITHWPKSPWDDPMTYPGGNGDGSLVYPGRDGPVGSIRWATVRDGTEDYDLLSMLRQARANASEADRAAIDRLLDVGAVASSFTAHCAAPEPVAAHRLAVGNLLERLARARR